MLTGWIHLDPTPSKHSALRVLIKAPWQQLEETRHALSLLGEGKISPECDKEAERVVSLMPDGSQVTATVKI